jgi:uncharacterized membrane protein (UPF0127 family)
MKASKAILLLLFASLLLVDSCGGQNGSTSVKTTPAATAPAETTSATTASTTESVNVQASMTIINSASESVPVQVEIADTPAKQEVGLMGRTALAANAGMLFVFDREVSLPFYMKDTLIPLSIAFIDSGGRIVDIQDMQPLDETNHPPAAPYQYALEVNQGFFAEYGIEVGNFLQLPER